MSLCSSTLCAPDTGPGGFLVLSALAQPPIIRAQDDFSVLFNSQQP